ncbi:hypothetical protein [Pyxidicoccus trucidator]|uniref:hypothetical protein n=1 Tax=Pyxidicoccus trucidator TaxID=2709662 RepID=UPI0013DD0120|nr:hypothetical protein [Pyxidicoccus trucidator]
MHVTDYSHELSRCGSFEELPTKERWSLMQAWRRAYAGALHAATGKWTRGEFDWHVFSFHRAPAYSGARALEAYRAERPEVLIVIPHSEALPAVRLHPSRLPEFPGTDLYIFPPDCAWTLAFTHEDASGLGPFFSRRQEADPEETPSEA